MSFFSLLGILFIALKLTHVIAWSWWLVLVPLYAPLVVFLVAVVACVVGGMFGTDGNIGMAEEVTIDLDRYFLTGVLIVASAVLAAALFA